MEDIVFNDLSQLDVMTPSDEGYWLELINPVNKKPIYFVNEHGETVTAAVHLAGPHSERMQKYVTESLDKALRDGRKGTLANDADAIRSRETALYAHATLGWRLPKIDGQFLAYSPKACRQVYEDLRFPWIREQVAAGVADSSPFLKKLQDNWSASPSEPSN